MQPSNSIPFSSVILDNRLRQTYTGIEDLASGIETVGLIQPLVLVPKWRYPETMDVAEPDCYMLVAGGRRYTALAQLGCTTLYHATSSDPARPGYILKGEHGDELMNLLTEISENHDREDVPWQEELPAIVRAWRMIEAQHHKRGEEIGMRAFGAMLGTGYHNLQASVAIYEAFVKDPARFQAYATVRQAYAALLKDSAAIAARLHVANITTNATLTPKIISVAVQPGPQKLAPIPTAESGAEPSKIIPLSQMFLRTNSLDLMETMPAGYVNHILCDPDFAVAKEKLSVNSASTDSGVAQDSVAASLFDLCRFVKLAYRVVDDAGFCVFWIDMNHWNFFAGRDWFQEFPGGLDFGYDDKLQRVPGRWLHEKGFAEKVGWKVQRWPLTWRKLDHRSNAAPQHNFCKNEEWCLVLRKPGAVLNEAQMSSVFDMESGPTARRFNHPFAKPIPLWRWILHAIARKGQKIYDPFMGSGSSCCAAIEHGCQPLGSELSEDHHANALFNIQLQYQKTLGPDTIFT